MRIMLGYIAVIFTVAIFINLINDRVQNMIEQNVLDKKANYSLLLDQLDE